MRERKCMCESDRDRQIADRHTDRDRGKKERDKERDR